MSKKVTIAVDKDGRIATDYDGFDGDDCFSEARKLKAALKELGIETDEGETARKDAPPKVPVRKRVKEGG